MKDKKIYKKIVIESPDGSVYLELLEDICNPYSIEFVDCDDEVSKCVEEEK